MLAPGKITFPQQEKLIHSLLGKDHRYGLPSWEEAYGDVNDEAFAGVPNGTILGGLYLDPFAKGVAERYGIAPHPYYPIDTAGVALGATNRWEPKTLLDLYPDYYSDRMRRLMGEGRTFSLAERTNALNRSAVRRGGVRGLHELPVDVFEQLFGEHWQRRVMPRTSQGRR